MALPADFTRRVKHELNVEPLDSNVKNGVDAALYFSDFLAKGAMQEAKKRDKTGTTVEKKKTSQKAKTKPNKARQGKTASQRSKTKSKGQQTKTDKNRSQTKMRGWGWG
jgi:hypothetical protein